MSSTDETCRTCKICYAKTEDNLISPCKCKGSLAYVHRNCLKHWVEKGRKARCEICLSEFSGVNLSVTQPGLIEYLKGEPLLFTALMCVVVANLIDIYLLVIRAKFHILLRAKETLFMVYFQTELDFYAKLSLGLLDKRVMLEDAPLSVFISGPVTANFVITLYRMFKEWQRDHPIVVMLD